MFGGIESLIGDAHDLGQVRSGWHSARPMLIVTQAELSSLKISSAAQARRSTSAYWKARSLAKPVMRMANSSPPCLATSICSRSAKESRTSAIAMSTLSPNSCPNRSLIALKRSISHISAVVGRSALRALIRADSAAWSKPRRLSSPVN
jgi:hypothetical protein